MALYVTRPRRDEVRIGRGLPSVIMSHKSTQVITTLPLTQQRDWHLYSVNPTAWAEPNTYSALAWHYTQRILSPVYKQQRSLKSISYIHAITSLSHRFICASKAPLS